MIPLKHEKLEHIQSFTAFSHYILLNIEIKISKKYPKIYLLVTTLYDISSLPKNICNINLNINVKFLKDWENDRAHSKPVKCKLFQTFFLFQFFLVLIS